MGPSRHGAVLGRPIAHSLSPVLHATAYRELGLAWTFGAVDCGTDELAAVLASRDDWAGVACTMPLKRAALELADEVGPVAAAVGAANTLLPLPGGGWRAENTDVAGVVGALGAGFSPSTVTLLGAGGTAQAVVVALAQLGVDRCTALVRDPARAEALRRTGAAAGVQVHPAALDAPALGAGLVVSTLPPGAADRLAEADWRPDQVLLDVVYAPWPTALAAAAARAGATVVSGALMLLHQAAAQVELMTGRPAPLTAMRSALVEAIGGHPL